MLSIFNDIDLSIISSFRSKINDNNDKFFDYFRDHEGKDHWGLICSCMDWISSSAKYLKYQNFSSTAHNLIPMELYSVISSIAIIVEGIKQLNRVLSPDCDFSFSEKRKYFNKTFRENEHFKKYNDSDVFTEIRAMMGAHSVNLSWPKGNKRERFYASWPMFRLESGLIKIRVYTNSTETYSKEYSIDLEEVKDYLDSRYEYLTDLTYKLEEIQKQRL